MSGEVVAVGDKVRKLQVGDRVATLYTAGEDKPGFYCEFINRETLVVAMIESPVGIDNCDAIAAVDGMDALFIGAGDLSWEYGIPGQTDHELIVSAYEKVIAACQRHGKIAGMAGIRDRELVRRFMKMGARFILVNNDLRLLMAGGKASTSAVREFDAD